LFNLTQLRTFQMIYRLGSFSKASVQLHLTQPALSKQIQQLEHDLGHSLFTRVPKGVVPTAAADELLRRISTHLDALDAIAQSFDAGTGELAGTVYLGGPSEFLGTKILPALADVHRDGIQLRVKLGQPEQLLDELVAGALDLFVSTVRLSHPKIELVPLYRETLILVANPSWGRLSISEDTLKTIPLLSYNEELPLIRRFWREAFNTTPDTNASIVIGDLRAIVQSLKAGAGMSVIPSYLLEDDLKTGELIELYKPAKTPTNQLYLVSLRRKNYPRVEYLKNLLVQVLYVS
jgi:DNA-binding transcriptional LysR family regulator